MSGKITELAPGATRPVGVPQSYQEHVKLMFDVMTLAFRTDSTRIGTFVMAHDGSNKVYPEIGVGEGHHELSHHESKPEKKEKIAKINRMHMELFAAWLNQLKSVKEGEGTMLDNCMIVYGSGIEDGNSHAHHNLPVLLAGGGGGLIKSGRHPPLCEGHADGQSLPDDARPHERLARALRRQYRPSRAVELNRGWRRPAATGAGRGPWTSSRGCDAWKLHRAGATHGFHRRFPAQIRTLNSSAASSDSANAAINSGMYSRSLRLTTSTGECM